MAKVVGGPVDAYVIDQLNKRGDLLAKRTNRTAEDIRLLHGRNSWVRVSSAVDVNGSSTVAEENVLNGITLDNSQKQRSGIDLKGDNPNAAYKKGPLGFRPVPGITDVNIRALNRFGTLRQANISITCWDRDQLSIIEKLYLRPGFSILVEWGHTDFIDKFGNVESNPGRIAHYFRYRDKDLLQEDIAVLKEITGGNYDAMYGYVKNFQWSYRSDGGYDCTVTVVSIGEIIESIKTTFAQGEPTEISTTGEEEDNVNKNKYLSPLHTILAAFIEAPGETGNSNTPWLSEIDLSKVPDALPESFSGNYSYTVNKLKLKAGTKWYGATEYEFLTYIKLRDLLQFVNMSFMVNEENANKKSSYVAYYTHNERISTDIDKDGKLLYLESPKLWTFPGHHSLDLGICILPKLHPGTFFAAKPPKDVLAATFVNFQNRAEKYRTRIPGAIRQSLDYQDTILDIHVCVERVFEELTQISQNSDAEERTVHNFIRRILDLIEDNLGGVNELDVTFDEKTSRYVIVDRKLPVDKESLDKAVINLTGIRSTVSSLDMTSKLSPKLGAMIAISAQANRADVGFEAQNMFEWNRGLTDRISPAKTLANTTNTNTEDDSIEKVLSAKFVLMKTFSSLSPTGFGGDYIDYEKVDFDSAKSAHHRVSRYYSDRTAKALRSKTKPGIIPFELNITLDGIGGLKIGEAFRIAEGILPQEYDDKIAFIITGVDHSISNNKWYTTIKAQTITYSGN